MVAKNWYDTGKKVSNINTLDLIMLKKEQRNDQLDINFDGPFEVHDKRGVIVQIAMGAGKKWVHLNRCKEYDRGARFGYALNELKIRKRMKLILR